MKALRLRCPTDLFPGKRLAFAVLAGAILISPTVERVAAGPSRPNLTQDSVDDRIKALESKVKTLESSRAEFEDASATKLANLDTRFQKSMITTAADAKANLEEAIKNKDVEIKALKDNLANRLANDEASMPPVGSIMAYDDGNATRILNGCWQYCDGSVVDDPQSPWHGQHVPKIDDERFLMAQTLEQIKLISSGGSNDIPLDGAHTHSFSGNTGGAPTSGATHLFGGDVEVPRASHSHSFSGTTGGVSQLHNHGGDKRPRYYGVCFYFRIK